MVKLFSRRTRRNPDMTKRKIIVHAGLPKTGTTSIQEALYKHRTTLLDSDRILYPSISDNHTNALCTMFLAKPETHIANRMAGRTTSELVQPFKMSCFEQLENEISNSDWSTLLFSAEGLSNLVAPELESLRKWLLKFSDDIQVILWLRDPVSYSISVTQQLLKGGRLLEEMYRDPPLANFKGRGNNFIHVFGRENMNIRIFEECVKHQDGILGGFLDDLSLSPNVRSTILSDNKRSNESMSQEAALLLNELNKLRPLFVDGGRGKDRTFSELNHFLRIKGAKFDVPFEVKRKIENLSAPDINWLEAETDKKPYSLKFQGDKPPPTAATMSKETISTLAILLSDILNKSHVLQNLLTQNSSSKTELSSLSGYDELLSQFPDLASKPYFGGN